MCTLQGCGPNVAAAFTPAGDTIVIGSAEDTVALYAVQSQKPVELPNDFQAALSQRLSCLPGTLQGISFLPDPQASPYRFLQTIYHPSKGRIAVCLS